MAQNKERPSGTLHSLHRDFAVLSTDRVSKEFHPKENYQTNKNQLYDSRHPLTTDEGVRAIMESPLSYYEDIPEPSDFDEIEGDPWRANSRVSAVLAVFTLR